MPVLAIAGGTSRSLGRAIAVAVVSSPIPQWTVDLLSRSTTLPAWLQALPLQQQQRIQVKPVDYRSHESLTSALQGVHTLISILFSIDGCQATREIALLQAAIDAGVRRFAPTAWGLPGLYWNDISEPGVLAGLNAGVWEACLAAMSAKGSTIHCARFNLGVFMNYLGCGIWEASSPTSKLLRGAEGLKSDGAHAMALDEATEGIEPQGDMGDGSGSFLISLRSRIAELPIKDDGGWPRVTMTTVGDVGRFVTASLELERWEEDMSIVGDTVGLGELLHMAEEITGEKFKVKKLKRENLTRSWKEVREDADKYVDALWLQFKLLYCSDEEGKAWLKPVVNELCPEVKPTKVHDYLEKWWTIAQLEA